jgi:hypothetical protein
MGGIGYGGKTNAPIFYHLVNNSQCEEPKITFKKSKNVNLDINIISVKQAQYETNSRITSFTKEPVHIIFEYKYCLGKNLKFFNIFYILFFIFYFLIFLFFFFFSFFFF